MVKRFFSSVAAIAVAIAILTVFGAPGEADAQYYKCGALDEPICTIAKATKQAKKPYCPRGSFWDIGKGKCYSCGSGYNRTVFSVTSSKACEKPAYTARRKAQDKGKKYCKKWTGGGCENTFLGRICAPKICTNEGCPSGAFFDIGKGRCYSCNGYDRTIFSVTSNKACEKAFNPAFRKAKDRGKIGCPSGSFFDPRKGGECWSCPKGYDRGVSAVTSSNACGAKTACKSGLRQVGLFCEKPGRPKYCGRENQRACRVWEHIPSCVGGMMESPKQGGKCIKPPKGVDPFWGTMAEAAEMVWAAIRSDDAACMRATRNMQPTGVPFGSSLKGGVFAGQCMREITAGTICEARGVIDVMESIIEFAVEAGKGGGSDLLEGMRQEYVKQRKSSVCRKAESDAGKSIPAGPLKAALVEVTGSMCGMALMAGGETARDMVCLAKATNAGVFALGDGRATKQSCANLGRAIGKTVETAVLFGVTSKVGKPAKKWIKKRHLEKKASKFKKDRRGRIKLEDMKKLVERERTIDRILLAGKMFGILKVGFDSSRKVAHIKECIADWSAKEKFSAGAPVKSPAKARDSELLYGVDSRGDLLFYELSKSDGWLQTQRAIGKGWGGFKNVFPGRRGVLYAVGKNGNLYLYRYDHRKGRWAVSNKEIGKGWGRFKHLFSGGKGDIYAVDASGQLLLYKFSEARGFTTGAVKIGSGFAKFKHVLAGGNGIVYAIDRKGNFLVYRHNTKNEWEIDGKVISGGWNVFQKVFSTGRGRIFVTRPDGKLYAYRHEAGLHWYVANKFVGNGWGQAFGLNFHASIQPGSPPPASKHGGRKWKKFVGKARDIGSGANGATWVIGNKKTGNDYDIHRRKGKSWQKVKGNARRIDVGPNGNAWVITSGGEIYRYGGRDFIRVKGAAKDIGIGANGKVWIIGTKAKGKNFRIYRRDGNTWTDTKGHALRIDVGPKGNVWVVNATGGIYRHNGKSYINVSGPSAADIGVGADGTVIVTGKDGKPYVYLPLIGKFQAIRGGASVVTVDKDGNPWALNRKNEIYSWDKAAEVK